MGVILYNAIYILMIMFLTYIVFRYMGILFERNERDKYHEINNYYERQFELMKTTLVNTRALHHDLQNHLSHSFLIRGR